MAAEEKINVPALAEPCPSPASPIIAPPSLADHANPVIHTLRIPAKCRRGASKGNLATCSTCFVQVHIRLGCLHAVKPWTAVPTTSIFAQKPVPLTTTAPPQGNADASIFMLKCQQLSV